MVAYCCSTGPSEWPKWSVVEPSANTTAEKFSGKNPFLTNFSAKRLERRGQVVLKNGLFVKETYKD